MGVGYFLVNQTKRERIIFMHVAASTKHEIAGNPAAAAIVAWYMLQNAEDRVAFVSDSHDDWPFSHGSKEDLDDFEEVTGRVIDELISARVLADRGFLYVDPDEPETVFLRDLRNVWMDDAPKPGPD